MSTKTESLHPGEFLLSEAEGYRSRDVATVLSGQVLVAGQVVGKITDALTVAAPSYSGTGNGTITMDASTPVLDDAVVGSYVITCIRAGTNEGQFEVIDPTGVSLGTVKVGNTFANRIKFAIADGATDFVVGDKFTAVVTAGSGKIKAMPAGGAASPANDGTDNVYGVAYEAVDASGGDKKATFIVRDAEVASGLLTFSTSSISTLATTQLAALGVIAR